MKTTRKTEWYAIAVSNNKEAKVRKEIIRQSRIEGMEDQVRKILIPKAPVEVMRKGKRVTENRKQYDGYLICEFVYSPEVFHLVDGCDGVLHFLPDNRDPRPLTAEEVDRIQNGPATKEVRLDFGEGDRVEVTFGPFEGQGGRVKSIDENQPGDVTVTVTLRLWGQEVDVLLNWTDVKGV